MTTIRKNATSLGEVKEPQDLLTLWEVEEETLSVTESISYVSLPSSSSSSSVVSLTIIIMMKGLLLLLTTGILARMTVLQHAAAAAAVDALKPAPFSCNAAYSAPCARTNSQFLAVSIVEAFRRDMDVTVNDDDTIVGSRGNNVTTVEEDTHNTTTRRHLVQVLLEEIQAQQHNMDTGFYPFVFRRADTICMAHGDRPEWAGLSLQRLFNEAGIAFSDADALHQRFVAAAEQGGGWVQYLSSDRRRRRRNGGHTNDTTTSEEEEEEEEDVINSKLAYVTNLTSAYYLGVGYENKQLPPDVPCSAEFDGWCSITNVRSLVGAAQFRLERAVSLENFEAAVYELSFDAALFTIEEGFYPFLFHYDGRLKAHAILHDAFGLRISDIFERHELGTKDDGDALHARFVAAADAQQDGTGSGWVQYQWRNRLDEAAYTKIAFLTKIVFREEEYYLGVGYNFAMEETARGPLDEECSSSNNLPCSFKTALQLSSHSLSHAITAGHEQVSQKFDELTHDPRFSTRWILRICL